MLHLKLASGQLTIRPNRYLSDSERVTLHLQPVEAARNELEILTRRDIDTSKMAI